MDLDDIKRGLRAEIKKRENEQYATCQCNVRQMCKDVLAKLEEQESVLAEKDKKIQSLEYLCENYRCDCDDLGIMTDRLKKSGLSLRQNMNHQKYKRCMAMAQVLEHVCPITNMKAKWRDKWHKRWLSIAEKFNEAK